MRKLSGGPCLHYDCSNRNSFGYCKTTVCINEHYRQEQWGLQSTTNKSESVVIKQQTNADRIRSMTDEELATWMNCMQSNAYHCGEFGRTNAAYPFDNKAWNDWLKSPVEMMKGVEDYE
jgi:hypothetical protein